MLQWLVSGGWGSDEFSTTSVSPGASCVALSAYGWAFYFGNIREQIEQGSWSNVCVGCGAGHPASGLLASNLVRRRWLFFKAYSCPSCGSLNLFTRDK